MKILKGVYKMIVYLGFVFFLFIVSLIVTSFVYFNHNLDTINKQNEMEVYLHDEVLNFSSYGDNQINIEVEFKEKKSNEFVMMYAYYFFDRTFFSRIRYHYFIYFSIIFYCFYYRISSFYCCQTFHRL